MSNKSSKVNGVRVVSELAIEMRNAVIALAGERSWHETRQRWLERAARRAGISYRSARALFYCEPHQPRASVLHSVRAAVGRLKEEEAKNRDAELAEIRKTFEATAARLSRIDAEFYLPAIESFRRSAQSESEPSARSRSDDLSLDSGDAE